MFVAVALAAPAPAADVRTGSVSAGLGGSWLFGGNASGLSPGLSERISGEVALSTVSALTLDVDHARHRAVDAAAWFTDPAPPEDAMTGYRDYVAFDLGARVGLDLTDPARAGDPRVTVVPALRFGVAVVRTTTLLTVPSFDGARPLRSTTVWPALSLGASVEINLRRWLSVVPHVKTQVLLMEDQHERDTRSTWGLEWRLQPALDASFHF